MAYNPSAFAAGGAPNPRVGAAAALAQRNVGFGPTPPTGPTTPPASSPPPAAPTPPPAAPPPPNPLSGLPAFLRGLAPPGPLPGGSTDPAYLAYLRGLEYQRQVAMLGAQRQIQNLQGQMTIGPEQLAAEGVIARRGISGAAESRGVFRSGERLQNLADERTQEAQRLAALRLTGAGQFGDILTNLQGTLAGYSNQAAEEALADQARSVLA